MTFCAVSLSTGCTCKEEPRHSFETVEESRVTARENSGILARKFRAESKLESYDLMLRGDSTITPECPQGDGWASIDLVDRTTNEVVKLKCSTASSGLGCMTDQDFKQRVEYAKQDGKCNTDVPFPLPKILN